MTFPCRRMVWGVDWIHLVRVRVGIKNQVGHLVWKCAFLLLFEPFRGVKVKGSEIGWGEVKEEWMTFPCRRMVLGVGWLHLVEEGVGIKNQGGHCVWKYAFLLLFEPFRGVKDKGSEIGWGERREDRMTFPCRGMVWKVDWIHLVWVGVEIKKKQGGHLVWKYAFLLLFEPFRGVKVKGSEIGWGERRKEWITFPCRGMMCGVDWIHLVEVGVGIKKPGGSLCLEICIFATIWVIQRGQGQGLRD